MVHPVVRLRFSDHCVAVLAKIDIIFDFEAVFEIVRLRRDRHQCRRTQHKPRHAVAGGHAQSGILAGVVEIKGSIFRFDAHQHIAEPFQRRCFADSFRKFFLHGQPGLQHEFRFVAGRLQHGVQQNRPVGGVAVTVGQGDRCRRAAGERQGAEFDRDLVYVLGDKIANGHQPIRFDLLVPDKGFDLPADRVISPELWPEARTRPVSPRIPDPLRKAARQV